MTVDVAGAPSNHLTPSYPQPQIQKQQHAASNPGTLNRMLPIGDHDGGKSNFQQSTPLQHAQGNYIQNDNNNYYGKQMHMNSSGGGASAHTLAMAQKQLGPPTYHNISTPANARQGGQPHGKGGQQRQFRPKPVPNVPVVYKRDDSGRVTGLLVNYLHTSQVGWIKPQYQPAPEDGTGQLVDPGLGEAYFNESMLRPDCDNLNMPKQFNMLCSFVPAFGTHPRSGKPCINASDVIIHGHIKKTTDEPGCGAEELRAIAEEAAQAKVAPFQAQLTAIGGKVDGPTLTSSFR